MKTPFLYPLFFLLAALNLATLTSPTVLPSPVAVNPAAQITSSNVLIHDYFQQGFGSGVVIELDGRQFVLTAYHVVRHIPEAEQVYIAQGENSWTGKVWFQSSEPDLALILPDEKLPLPAATVDLDTLLVQGEEVWYVGNPQCHEGLVERTIICAVTREDYFVISGLGWFGNSGGAVYVIRDGKPVLVGIVVRLCWGHGKAPLFCETQARIRSFLAHVP